MTEPDVQVSVVGQCEQVADALQGVARGERLVERVGLERDEPLLPSLAYGSLVGVNEHDCRVAALGDEPRDAPREYMRADQEPAHRLGPSQSEHTRQRHRGQPVQHDGGDDHGVGERLDEP